MPKTHVIAIEEHPRRQARLEFDIDFGSGEISNLVATGINPDYALRQLQSFADRDRVFFAWQQSYPAPDPLHVPQSFAWHMFASGWLLEGAMAQYAPPLPDDLPEGAVA